MGFFDNRLKQSRQKAPMMGTLGGPGYGEFPLGSAGPRVDPRDPNYRPPPRPGGGNPNPFNNPLFSDPGLGGEGGRGGDNLLISPGGSRKFAEENYGRIKNPFPQFPDGPRRAPRLPPSAPVIPPVSYRQTVFPPPAMPAPAPAPMPNPNLPAPGGQLIKPQPPAISYEEMKAMPMSDEKVAAAKAITAYAGAMKDYRRQANPNIDYSEAGIAATVADARRFLAENASPGGMPPQLPPTIPIARPPSSGGQSYSDVVNAGGGGINPVVGKRADGSDIRLFDKDSPTKQSPGQIPPMTPSDPGDIIFDTRMPPMRTMDFQDANGNGIDDRDENTQVPRPRLPGGGRILEDIFGKGRDDPSRRPPKLPPLRPPMSPPESGGSDEGLFGNQNKAGYDRILSNLYQDQYRNQGSPYAAQADYLMNRPVFDRGVRTDNPMFTFEKKDDPFATMSSQQYLRDEADAAALANQQAAQAEQERIAAEEAAAAQAAADAKTAEEAAIAAAEQERVAAEKAAAEAAAEAESQRLAEEAAAQEQAAAAAAAQEAAAAEAATAQMAAEAESQRLAEEAEAQRMADVQARIDAMESRFGGFEGRFGGFDPAAVQERIAAAQEAARAAEEQAAANAAVVSNIDPDIQERINALQGEFGRFGNFDPAAIQASIAAAQEAAASNAAAIENTPAVDPALQARIDAMQNEVGGLGRRFEGFDPRNVQANIAAARQAAEDARAKASANEAAVAAVPQFDASDIQARIAELGGRFGNLGERVNRISEREIPQFDASSINQRIDALANRETPQFDASSINQRIDALANREIPQFDDSAIQERIRELGGRFGNLGDRVNQISEREIPQFDDSAIQERIRELGGRVNNISEREIPRFDDSAIQSRIDALANREIPQFDASDIRARIDALANREIPQFDDSAIQSRIDALANREIPQFDASDIQARIRDLGGRVNTISEREIPRFDDSAIRKQIEDLRSTIPTGIPAAEVPPMLPGTGIVPGVKINTDTLPGNLTGIGDGRATPLPKTRTRQTVKTPPPPTRTIMPVKPPRPVKAPPPPKRTPIKRAPIKRTPIKRAPIKPVKSAPPKKTTTKRPAPRGRVTDKRTRRGRGR